MNIRERIGLVIIKQLEKIDKEIKDTYDADFGEFRVSASEMKVISTVFQAVLDEELSNEESE